ncbi:MAG: PulJ/GspJ family protein [Chlamydiia bacterium]
MSWTLSSSPRSRRSALLLEVLIAMAIAAVGLVALFEGPILLMRYQSKQLAHLQEQRAVDRLLIQVQASLVQEGGSAVQRWAHPVPIQVRMADGTLRPLLVTLQITKQDDPPHQQGERWRIEALYHPVAEPQRVGHIQTSIALEDPR